MSHRRYIPVPPTITGVFPRRKTSSIAAHAFSTNSPAPTSLVGSAMSSRWCLMPSRWSSGSLEDPTSKPRNTCTESALTTSPPSAFATERLSLVLPTAVGPAMTSTLLLRGGEAFGTLSLRVNASAARSSAGSDADPVGPAPSARVGTAHQRTQRRDARHRARLWPWGGGRARATSRQTETRIDAETHAAPIARVMAMASVAAPGGVSSGGRRATVSAGPKNLGHENRHASHHRPGERGRAFLALASRRHHTTHHTTHARPDRLPCSSSP